MQAGNEAYQRGNYAEAVAQFEAALREAEKFGSVDLRLATSLNSLALLYRAQGRYAEAEPLYQRSLGIREKSLGAEHPDVAQSLNNLAELYRVQGRYAEAEPLYQRSLAILEKVLEPGHPHVARSFNNLAVLYRAQGRYAEAELLYKRALAILEKVLGPEHPDVAASLNNLAELYRAQGRYEEAEPLYQRALALAEKALGPEHPAVAAYLSNLAALYETQGRYGEAEPLYQRALTVTEKALGPEHPTVGTRLNNLAALYETQGRYEEAEPLYQRALTVTEKALGLEHPAVGTRLNNLALLYKTQGRYGEAEPRYQRALTVTEKALGPEHPEVATSLHNLAALYRAQGRYGEAEPRYQRALTITEKALGPEHPAVGTRLNSLALLYKTQGRYGEAEPRYQRALTVTEKALGPEHPNLATSLNNLAALYEAQNRVDDALAFARRATEIYRKHGDHAADTRSAGARSERQHVRFIFTRHVSLLHQASRAKPEERANFTAEAYEIGQLASTAIAARALARMAARFAAGDDDLARLVRARQDAIDRWHALNGTLVKAISQPATKGNPALVENMRDQLESLDKKLEKLDDDLKKQYPDYFALTNPKPINHTETQALLRPDEALLSYLVTPEERFLWVVPKKGQPSMHRLNKDDLNGQVTELRRTLDKKNVRRLKDIPPFPLNSAHALFNTIFAPAEPLLEDVSHVLLVPDGPLQSLPFGVLVTERTEVEPKDFANYREVPWLAKKYMLTVLPSPASLQHLREYAKASPASKPFIGFGDPILGGKEKPDTVALFSRLSSQCSIADADQVQKLRELPETADELRSISEALGGSSADVYLQEAATETQVKHKDLMPYRTVAFATHGLGPERCNFCLCLMVASDDNTKEEMIRKFKMEFESKKKECAVLIVRAPGEPGKWTIAGFSQGGEFRTVVIDDPSQELSKELKKEPINESRIVELATSSLGLTLVEPALVLTPPREGTEEDDGLLTASEVAQLKLNADWVILSACNTAAADTPGGEGLSGLARAFFYAGTRTLLVSHWKLNSKATVALITGMFKELADNPDIGRSEALRRSMLAVMNDSKRPWFKRLPT